MLAFDLVGQLPIRSKAGYKYLLTSTCKASKYPEAITLKRVDVESMAEGLCEVFSRTGIPALCSQVNWNSSYVACLG